MNDIHGLTAVTNNTGKNSAIALPSWIFHGYIRVLLDSLTAAASMLIAYILRFDLPVEPKLRQGMWIWMCAVAVMRPMTLYIIAGAYQATWRFFGLQDGLILVLRSLPVTIILLLIRLRVPGVPLVPYSILILELSTFLILAGSLRIMRRLTYESIPHRNERPRALIVGDEATLAAAIHHIHTCKEVQIVGLVSEDKYLVGIHIAGRPVLGTPESLGRLLVTHRILVVVLAGAGLKCAAQVIRDAGIFNVCVRILPSASDLIEGKVRVNLPVSIEHIQKNIESANEIHPAVKDCFNSQTVIVTGAGGSIGSEIARQVSTLAIHRLVLFDHDENSIFELMNEIGRRDGKRVIPVVGNIRDRKTLHRTFEMYSPGIILHTAAYKHVPVMEGNCCEAVLNNVTGTHELAAAAIRYSCKRMVMVSTDKAVHPSSVMGATKRMAELLLQQYATWNDDGCKTHFACVRLGNVLGSRGSVVPIFLRQIAAGGPVTITHEEMTRYFMTIPQAVRLILQASTLASHGDVYFLDMGDPVKIIDFAKQIIRLAGLTPEKDIGIKVIGVRPGEKLNERLWSEDAHVLSTPFHDVRQIEATQVPENFLLLLAELESAARRRRPDREILDLLSRLPIDYSPRRTTVSVAAKLSVSDAVTVSGE
ncbi:MAG: polysaccharide biosynthesis protein [Acidobacteriaceae bacterium]|nr:polysaccharide biosynthesis protein [Acidobacteriaceae bacterium]